MSVPAAPTPHQDSPQALARANRRGKRKSKGGGVTPRVKRAIEALIYEGCNQKEAAEAGGITYRSLRDAFRKPEVLQYFRNEMQVFREHARAGNIRTVQEIREDKGLAATAAGQKVRIEAAKYLDGEDGEGGRGSVNVTVGVAVTPGYVIDLSEPSQQGQEGGHLITHQAGDEAKPLIEQARVAAETGETRDE